LRALVGKTGDVTIRECKLEGIDVVALVANEQIVHVGNLEEKRHKPHTPTEVGVW